MKKSVKSVVALVLALLMFIGSQESFFAVDCYWEIIKTPGKTGVTTLISVPYYKEAMTYKLTSLSGTCSYVVAEFNTHPNYVSYFYMDAPIRFTKPASQIFQANITELGRTAECDLKFRVEIEHNSTNVINETLTATGRVMY